MGRKKLSEIISYEQFYEEYITNNLSINEIATKFNLKYEQLAYLNSSQYHIKKDLADINKNIQQTFLNKYNQTNPMKCNEIREKTKQTNLMKYGTEWSTQSEIVQNKIKATCLEKYGVESAAKNKQVHDKMVQGVVDKYGVQNVSQNKEIQNKIQQTMIDTYGENCYFKTEKFKQQSKKTCLSKYGTEFSVQNDQVKEKIKQTKFEKYGDPNYNNAEKLRETCVQKYGKEYFNQNEKFYNIFINKENLKSFIDEHFNGKCSLTELAEATEYSVGNVGKLVHKINAEDLITYIWDGESNFEHKIITYIKELGITNIIQHDRNQIAPQELDIYLPDYKVAIEINGNYWHSDIYKEKKYHYNKSIKCEEKGIRLIHLYEYELTNPVKFEIIKTLIGLSLGHVENKIYARKCEIREITNKEAKSFNDMNHIQGHRNAQVTYGLFYNDELVQLMSFSKHKNYEWEIIRGCPGSNNLVIGGVGKLFNHFIKEKNPTEVFSYCDYNKFNGVSYEAIGMQFIGFTVPDKHWLINGCHRARSASKYKIYNQSHDAILYGSGSKKYLWKNNKKTEN